MRRQKKKRQAATPTQPEHRYSPEEVNEMETIVLALAHDEHPFEYVEGSWDKHGKPTGLWSCRYCFTHHPAEHDRHGWPSARGMRHFTHATDCAWYWAQIFRQQHHSIAWPTLLDPLQTKPIPRLPPLYRRQLQRAG